MPCEFTEINSTDPPRVENMNTSLKLELESTAISSVEFEWYATNSPSPDKEGLTLSPLAKPPPNFGDASTVVMAPPSPTVATNTSILLLESPATISVQSDANAITDPSAEIEGETLPSAPPVGSPPRDVTEMGITSVPVMSRR